MELANSQRRDNFLNLERERDQDKRREGSVNTSHMSRSRSKGKRKKREYRSSTNDRNLQIVTDIDSSYLLELRIYGD